MDGRAGFWERFAAAIKPQLMYAVRHTLEENKIPGLDEQQFSDAFDEITTAAVRHANLIPPDAWASVMQCYADAITRQKLKGKMWPEQ